MIYYAHPNEPLKNHLLLVWNELKNLSNNNLEKDILFLIWISHDFWKYTDIFQWKIQNIAKTAEQWSLIQKYWTHSQLGAIFFFYTFVKNFRNKTNKSLPYYLIAGINAIFKHHWNLTELDYLTDKNFWDKTFEIVNKQIEYLNPAIKGEINEILGDFWNFDLEDFKNFIKQIQKWICNFFENILSNFDCNTSFLIKRIYSNLLYADKYKTIFWKTKLINNLSTNLDPNTIDRYRIEKWFDKSNGFLNNLRNRLYNEINEKLKNFDLNYHFLVLNAPTWIGKTLNLLNIWFKLSDKIPDSKIVYWLPFTSIIDQTDEILKDILKADYDKFVFKHHYLSWFEEKDLNPESFEKVRFLLNAWDKKIILTTFWQIFHTFFHNKNKLNIKFSNWKNTIFLLDEVQSIPYKYWKAAKQMMKILSEKYNCYFVLSSATLPKFLENEKVFNLVSDYKKYFNVLNRTKLNLSLTDEKINFDKLEKFVEDKIQKDKSILFVFNTIKSSIEFYNILKNKNLNKTIFYLSTNIIPKHRIERLSKIKQLINNWKNVILVSTQLIEAGVDIDFDIWFRDFAPIDSIIQVLWRLNRNAKKEQGELFLFRLKDENNPFEREYSSYIYDFLIRNKSEIILQNKKVIEEKDFLQIFEKYFEEILKEESFKKQSDIVWEYFCNWSFKKLNEKFNLIDKRFETIDIFVDIDNISSKIRKEFEVIKNIKDITERKLKREKIKKDFLSYVIQVSVTNAIKVGLLTNDRKSKVEYKDWIIYLDKNKLDTYYDWETGFKYETDDFI